MYRGPQSYQQKQTNFVSAKEKTLSCSVCLARVSVALFDRHESQCRQNALQKKSKGGVIRNTGSSYAPVKNLKKEPEYTPPPAIKRPISLMCYICGREYGTKSLPIHLKTCQEKWDNEQSNKPLKDRRAMPRAPQGFDSLIQKDNIKRQDIDNYNMGAFDSYNYDALVPCKNCGRTFKPESLIPHQKSCKSNNPLKPLSNAQKEYQAEKSYAMQNGNMQLVPCRKCGRKFASDRISKHESVCKPGPTKQAIKKQKQLELKEQKLKKYDKVNPSKQQNWRQQHEELQQQLQYMRKLGKVEKQGGNIKPLPPPPQSQASQNNFQQCPYCLRRFNDQALSRHQPLCQNQQKNITKASSQVQSSVKAQNMNNYGSNKTQLKQQSSIRPNTNNNRQQQQQQQYKVSKEVNFDDDYPMQYQSYSNSVKPTKQYKILNSNIQSSPGAFSTGNNGRDSWMKQMGSKQQKTHDLLYGIGEFSNAPISNNSAFPAPKGFGGFR